jgi:hypothetical protein
MSDPRIVFKDIDENTNVQLIVFQRGFVFVGVVTEVILDTVEGSRPHYKQIQIDNGYSILSWGTAAGLGELCAGPRKDTQLEPVAMVRLHELSSICQYKADWKAWREKLLEEHP